MTDQQRTLFETAVVTRMQEGGFLEIEIRTECLVRCDEGYQDEVINAGWHYWNAALAAQPEPETHAVAHARLLEAAKGVISAASDSYKKRNGHLASFQDDSGEKCWIVPFDAFEELRAALGTTSADELSCPVCLVAFQPDDLCATDIELSICHAACLEGSPVVDLNTGEPVPDGELHTYRFSETDPRAAEEGSAE